MKMRKQKKQIPAEFRKQMYENYKANMTFYGKPISPYKQWLKVCLIQRHRTMTKDEIKRLPFVVAAYQKIHPTESHCGICNLPWSACGSEHININDDYGVFYVCPHCWKKSDLQTVLKATTQGYLGQFHSCTTDENKAYFLKTHKLIDILMKTEQKYVSTHARNDEKGGQTYGKQSE